MLKDRPRQEAYWKAVLNNTTLFKDKIVLDVGAGTGILSAFCAQAGAKLVYAVEASNLAKVALDVIEENNLTSIVKVINSRIEDFALPISAEKVDIIVSEWMGFYLLHEGMLDSVIYARDKFLKPDGLLYPTQATIYVAPCTIPSLFNDWNQVDGVKMSVFAKKLREHKSTKPEIMSVKADDLLNEGSVLHWIDLKEVKSNELDLITFKEVVVAKKSGLHQGFCIWFDCLFPSDNYSKSIVLSTSPFEPKTHWKQCVIILPEANCEDIEINSPIAFSIALKRNAQERRKYNIEVELQDHNKVDHPLPCDCYLTKCILIKTHLAGMHTK